MTLAILASARNCEAEHVQGRLSLPGSQHLPARVQSVQDGVWQIASPLFHGHADIPASVVRAFEFEGTPPRFPSEDVFRFELRSGEVLVGRLLSLNSRSCSIEHFDLGVIDISSQQLVGLTRVGKDQKVFSAGDLTDQNSHLSVTAFGTIQLSQAGVFKIPFDATEGRAVSAMFRIQADTNFRLLVKVKGQTQITVHVSADAVMAELGGSLEFGDVEIQPGIEQLTCVFAQQRLSIRNKSGIEVLDLACKSDVAPTLEIICDSKKLEVLQARVDVAHKPLKMGGNQTGDVWVADTQGKSYACEKLTFKGDKIVLPRNEIPIEDLQSLQLLNRPSIKETPPTAFVHWADGSRMGIERFEIKDSKLFVQCQRDLGKQRNEVLSPRFVYFPSAETNSPTEGEHTLMLGDASFAGTFQWGDAEQPLRWQFDGFKDPVALMMNRKIIVSEFGASQPIDLSGLDRLILTNGTILPCQISSIDETSVSFQSRYCKSQTIPVDQFRACFFATRFGPGNANTVTAESLQRMLTIPRFSRDVEPEHVLISSSGDLLRGTLESLGEKHVSFDSRAELLRIDRQRISGIVRFSVEESDTNQRKDAVDANSVAINFGGDFVVVGDYLASAAGLQVNVPGLGVCRLPSEAKSVQVNADRIAMSSLYRYVNLNPVSSMDPRWTEPPVANVDAEQTKGKPAPDFQLSSLDGKPFRLSDHRGKVIVLDFWASWCQPCVIGIPGYLQVIQEFSEGEVVFAAINVGETGSKVEQFQREKQWDTNLLLDTQSQVANQYKANAIPHLVVIDRHGNVADVSIGYSPSSAPKLRQRIQELLSDEGTE